MAKGSSKEEPMEIDNQTKLDSNSRESFWWLKFVPQQNTWTNVNIFRFLRIYKTYPVLWDPKNQKYSKPSERSRAFVEISKKLNLQGVDEKECMKLVQSLKEIYIEEKRKREEASSWKNKYKPPPVWFQVLNDIVETVMNGKKEIENSSSGANIKNDIKKDQMKKFNNSMKIHTDNSWTPNHLKTEVWELFLQETKSHIMEEETNLKKGFEGQFESLVNFENNNHDRSCEALKILKSNNRLDNTNTNNKCKFGDYSSHSVQNKENFCLSSSQSQIIHKEKQYCPDFKSVLCSCSSGSVQIEEKYCPELNNLVCNCSSVSIQKKNKYCPDFKNICSSQSSQNSNKYCPEFINILCDCSSHSFENVEKPCPEFESILYNSFTDIKYCEENEDICDYSRITEYSDSKMRIQKKKIQKVATPFTFTTPTFNKKIYEKPYMIELDRYCYYKDWSEYYKCKICDSKERYRAPRQTEIESGATIYNQKSPRPHKNNTVFKSEINIFSDMNRHYRLQLFDCMEQGN